MIAAKITNSSAELDQLRKDVNAQTLRADRAEQLAKTEAGRADAEKVVSAALRSELTDVRKLLDANANSAAASSSDTAAVDPPEVRQLKNEVDWLRKQNSALLMLVAKDTTTAANMLSKESST